MGTTNMAFCKIPNAVFYQSGVKSFVLTFDRCCFGSCMITDDDLL